MARRFRGSRLVSAFGFEALETRRVLATVTWTGGGADNLWSNGDNWDAGGSTPGVLDDVVIPNGILGLGEFVDLDEGASVASLALSGDLNISPGGILDITGDLTTPTGVPGIGVAGQFTWRGGRVDRGGVVVYPGGIMEIAGPGAKTLAATLSNTGTLNMSGTSVTLEEGVFSARLVNEIGGVIAVSAAVSILDSSNVEALENRGAITIDNNATLTVGVLFTDYGTTTMGTASRLRLLGGGAGRGTIATASGSFVDIGDDAINVGFGFRGGFAVSGIGTVTVEGTGHNAAGLVDFGDWGSTLTGGLTIVAPTTMDGRLEAVGGSIALNAALRVAGQLGLQDSSLTGNRDAFVLGALVLRAGAELANDSSVLASPGASVVMDAPLGGVTVRDGATLFNQGVIDWVRGFLLIEAGAVVENYHGGRFNADSDGLGILGSGLLLNRGFFEVDISAGHASEFHPTFSNLTQPGQGGFKVVTGDISMLGPMPQFTGAGSLSYGVWSINAGAGMSVPGASVVWNNATVTLQGNATFPMAGLARNNGNLTLDRLVPFFEPAGGSFHNSGRLVKKGSGTTTIAATFRNTGTVRVEGPTGAGTADGGLLLEQPVFFNEGAIELGVRSRLRILGDYDEDAGASVTSTLLGTANHEMGRFQVNGVATLAGSLTVVMDAGSTAPVGLYKFFTVLGARVGTFGSVTLPDLSGFGRTASLIAAGAGYSMRVV